MEGTMRKGRKRKGEENRTGRLEIASEGGWIGREDVEEQEGMFCVRDGGGKRSRSDASVTSSRGALPAFSSPFLPPRGNTNGKWMGREGVTKGGTAAEGEGAHRLTRRTLPVARLPLAGGMPAATLTDHPGRRHGSLVVQHWF